jgi:hypothetical protein
MVRATPRIVVLGMITKMPVPGVIWQTLHYLIGLKRLGYDVYYVEAHGRTPSMFVRDAADDGSLAAAAFLARLLQRFDLGDRWAFHARHADGRCFGLSHTRLNELYDSALLLINLHGGTRPLPEHTRTNRLVLLETDPVAMQLELAAQRSDSIEFSAAHCARFTFGENYGQPDCGLPVAAFDFQPTRQPVVMDLWQRHGNREGTRFTTVGNWRQNVRAIRYQGDVYHWSKHLEFMKVIELPQRTAQSFELALASCADHDRALLEAHGWRVQPAEQVAALPDTYRRYIATSRGEFTVAKDQNIRFRSGWFSDRSVTYLAAGRPVINQETGFSKFIPTGAGLFSFTNLDEVLGAVEAINAAWAKHSRAAVQLAREHFSHDVVLPALLARVDVRPARTVARGVA